MNTFGSSYQVGGGNMSNFFSFLKTKTEKIKF